MTIPTILSRAELDKLRAEVEAGPSDARAPEINRWLHDALMPEPKVVQEPNYLGNLGAASFLVLMALPDWTYVIDASLPLSGIDCVLYSPFDPEAPGITITGVGKTEPLARVAALLRVLVEKAS